MGVTSDEGVDVLVHVGLDTVLLGGAGFEVAVTTGERVTSGQVLLHVDRAALAHQEVDLTSPVVITNARLFTEIAVVATGSVTSGDPVLHLSRAASDPA